MSDDTDTEEYEPPHLWFGETPWDSMTRDEVIREAQRLYFAAEQMKGALLQLQLGNEAHWLWAPQAIPTRALAIGVQALAPYHRGNGQSSDIHYAFFRAAAELLFPSFVRGGTRICECGLMVSANPDGTHDGYCPDCAYKGRTSASMRPIEWRDMAPAAIEFHPATCADMTKESDDS